MGAVAMDRPDFVRGVLIGMAPLIVGSIAVVLVGNHVFDVNKVVDAAKTSDLSAITDGVQAAFAVNDAWIWLYLIFAISTAMLPSESDREALWPMAIFVAAIAVMVLLAGWGPALIASLAEPVAAALSLLVVAFPGPFPGIRLCTHRRADSRCTNTLHLCTAGCPSPAANLPQLSGTSHTIRPRHGARR
jgi:hypothetical protein